MRCCFTISLFHMFIVFMITWNISMMMLGKHHRLQYEASKQKAFEKFQVDLKRAEYGQMKPKITNLEPRPVPPVVVLEPKAEATTKTKMVKKIVTKKVKASSLKDL
eukprot:TRINITY_DN8893_c0_g1_i1.p1 TRINITY_DN8893_c0_g1~~TRINITY_DN8893_c0_g1_i1.p1  ORF type:complete len:106 (+),score=10.90 TRINITY_DN8893_c0_g1_i1:95-412(+)